MDDEGWSPLETADRAYIQKVCMAITGCWVCIVGVVVTLTLN